MIPPFETAPLLLAVTAVLAYVLGSVPFGMVMAQTFGLGDVRAIGSGNIGATNVLRTGHKTAAALTLILDGAKGAAAVAIARAVLAEDAAHLAALAAFLGHCFSIFLRLQGGKGVATFLGILLALYWPVGMAGCLTWLIVAAITRYSSLSALIAAALSPIFAMWFGWTEGMVLTLTLVILIFFRHRANLYRLITSHEPKFGSKGAS